MAAYDADAIASLFAEESHWRDLVVFTWHIRTFSSRDAIREAFTHRLTETKPRNFSIASGRTPPRAVTRAGTECIEANFTFETETSRGSGILRLVPAPERSKQQFVCWVLLTTLDAIKGHEEQIGVRRPRGEEWSGGFGTDNWLDVRQRTMAYEDREPSVVVVGGSQSGLGIAACLNVLGVDTLVVDNGNRGGPARPSAG